MTHDETPLSINDSPFGGIRLALLVYAVLVPIAWSLSHVAPGRKDWPVWMFAAVLHGVLCGMIGVITKLVLSVLKVLSADVRLDGESVVFLRVLSIWPLVVVIWMLIRKWLA